MVNKIENRNRMLHESLMQTPVRSRKYTLIHEMRNVCCQDRAANMMQLRCSRAQALRPSYVAVKEAGRAIT